MLVFLNSFWNNGKGISGADQIFIQVFKRIRTEFNKVYVYTSSDGRTIINNSGISGIEIMVSKKIFDKFNIFYNYIFRTIKAFSCLKLKDVDIVYSTSDFFPDVLPAYFFRKFNGNAKWIQCVFHVYPDWRNRPGNKIRSFVAEYLQKFSFFLIKRADCVININLQVKEYLVSRGFDNKKIFVNPPGIDFSFFENIKEDGFCEKYDAVFLGRLNPSKGLNDLIGIWSKVVKKNKNAKLAIIGGGSEKTKNELRNKAISSEVINNIRIFGFLEDSDAFLLMKNSKLFVFPSHEEGFGIAVAEAMACNVPVVAWNLPVYDEAYKDHMIQIKENDLDAFAAAILNLLDNESKRAFIAEKARIYIRKYDWSIISKKHLEIIQCFDNWTSKNTENSSYE